MFKKILALAVVSISIATAAFAEEKFALNVGISFPQVFNLKADGQVHIKNVGNEDIKTERYSAAGINLGARGLFPGMKLGLYGDVDIYWPIKYIRTTDSAKIEYPLKEKGVKLWGIEGTVGVYSPILSVGFFSLPIGIGLHMNYINHKVDISSSFTDSASTFSLGLGAFVNAEFSIGAFTIYGGVRIAWDFYTRARTENVTSEGYKTSDGATVTYKKKHNSTSSGTSMLYVVPAVGIMFKF